MTTQSHLGKWQTINLGSFYTPDFIINMIFSMLDSCIENLNDFVLFDSSCGYGSFLNTQKQIHFTQKIGVDIDKKALDIAKANVNNKYDEPVFLHKNSLQHCTRANFGIAKSAPLIIVGNPPYNDRTSIIQHSVKNAINIAVDSDLHHRDLGISFLRSFDKLKADYVCVLHPLSYLIKESNFKALKNFAKHYILLDSIIISSEIFCPNSKSFFPIIIALYKRECSGMDYNFVKHYLFRTIEGKVFRLSDFDFINNYIDKYPNKKYVAESNKVAMFYTLRDINALRRSKTFLQKDCTNAVYVTQDKYSLYCYIDVFKKFIPKIPYYFGNYDIMIDYTRFKELESYFIKASECGEIVREIEGYFRILFGKHYMDL